MDIHELEEKKHELEVIRDKLWNELAYIDNLMRQVGFSNGLETVKATVEELLDGHEEEGAA